MINKPLLHLITNCLPKILNLIFRTVANKGGQVSVGAILLTLGTVKHGILIAKQKVSGHPQMTSFDL